MLHVIAMFVLAIICNSDFYKIIFATWPIIRGPHYQIQIDQLLLLRIKKLKTRPIKINLIYTVKTKIKLIKNTNQTN